MKGANQKKQYYSNDMTLWKRQNYGDSKNISGFQGLEGKEGWIGGALGIFSSVKLLCMTQ